MNKQQTIDVHQNFYQKINFIYKEDSNIEFMNHGYHPIDTRLTNSSILLKNSATLYTYIMSKINLDNVKSILEVGCGRGGGISLIRDMYNIKDIYGCDICEENINYCIRNHNNIEFKIQDACDLNYDKKFDIVLNVESSHCYTNIKKFFQGVLKSLESNGFFLYADVFFPQRINSIRSELKKNFYILEEEDITQNVYLSCINSIKILEEHPKITNPDSYNLLLDISEKKKRLYKNRNLVFYVFVCKHKLPLHYH